MNLAGLDIATTSGLTSLKSGVYEATTFKASVKKSILDDDEKSGAIRADYEGLIARMFRDFLRTWLIENNIGHVAIEAPLPSNNSRTKTIVDTETNWAGKSLRKVKVDGTSFASIFRIYGLEMIAVMVCAELNIQVTFVHQGTWRKEFLGTGKPKDAKREAKRACEAMGIKVSSLDAAESVGVCWWLNQHLNPYSGGRRNDLFPAGPATADLSKINARERANALFKPSTNVSGA